MSPEEISSQGESASAEKKEPSLVKTPEGKPEDIFAETEIAPPSATERPSETAKIITEPVKVRARFNWRILIIPLIIIILLGAIYGGYLLVKNYQQRLIKKKELSPKSQELETTPLTETPATIINDKDGDGLTDKEEAMLRTDSNNPDTDNDGLFDKEEVKIYQTNPLNPDNDGDGIPDGAEVKKGDDPNNPTPGAKLLELEKEIKNLF